MPTDYEAEYDNRARVPGYPAIFARWEQDSEKYRAATAASGHAELGIAYGGSARQFVDIFNAQADDPPVALFLHGGYWRAFEPRFFSFVAEGLNACDVTVAVAGYDLAPQVSIGEIVAQVRKSCLFLWERYSRRIRVFGHSAGGHLAACLLATDWPALDPTVPQDLVPAAYSISGLFDLAPFVHLKLNQDLRLDEEQARAQSPVLWAAPAGRIFEAVVGASESNEYLRQSRLIVDEWGRQGVRTRYAEIPGANHFTALDPLTDATSGMVRRIAELCRTDGA
jgi:arylformamidase